MKTLDDLKTIRDKESNRLFLRNPNDEYRIVVGMSTCGITAGAKPVYKGLVEEVKKKNLSNVTITQVGCIGKCSLEPIVEIYDKEGNRVTYCKVKADDIEDIIEKHIFNKKIIKELLLANHEPHAKQINGNPKKVNQKRIALRNCGVINPFDIKEYIARDGYISLAKSLIEMTSEEIINIIKESGLRGRGGGGFPTGFKWSLAAKHKGVDKYIICNADEGDPGAFMDRSILEGDPHSVIEAMTIGAYAIGASQGYIYIRAEYPLAVKSLNHAIKEAYDMCLLGNNILGTDFSFDLEIRLGAGAFVCGEETALMASIEGERGMPRNKPPFPADSGLWGKSSIINNVETYANIAQIILKGADWFKSIGTDKSKGTKVFALGGKINNTGLLEIPMGTTLREVIYDLGGGIPKNRKFKALQTGGPSGGCLTADHLDCKIDYDNLVSLGSMMGSGGMIVMDEDNCMVDVARFFLDFTVDESCGKCTPCREGTKRMLEILNKITSGKGTLNDIDMLEDLCYSIKDSALCGLGQTAPNPVLSTLKHFRNEYISHVIDKRCEAGVCKSLIQYYITDICIGCTKCARTCPVGSIKGNAKFMHEIKVDTCIKCGACRSVCPVGAIITR